MAVDLKLVDDAMDLLTEIRKCQKLMNCGVYAWHRDRAVIDAAQRLEGLAKAIHMAANAVGSGGSLDLRVYTPPPDVIIAEYHKAGLGQQVIVGRQGSADEVKFVVPDSLIRAWNEIRNDEGRAALRLIVQCNDPVSFLSGWQALRDRQVAQTAQSAPAPVVRETLTGQWGAGLLRNARA